MKKEPNNNYYIFCGQFEAVEEIGAGDLGGLLGVTGGHLLGGALENGAILRSVDAATGAQFVHEFLGIGFLVVDVVRHAERASRLKPTLLIQTQRPSLKSTLLGFGMATHGDRPKSPAIRLGRPLVTTTTQLSTTDGRGPGVLNAAL